MRNSETCSPSLHQTQLQSPSSVATHPHTWHISIRYNPHMLKWQQKPTQRSSGFQELHEACSQSLPHINLTDLSTTVSLLLNALSHFHNSSHSIPCSSVHKHTEPAVTEVWIRSLHEILLMRFSDFQV
jgi:hypothetical protein